MQRQDRALWAQHCFSCHHLSPCSLLSSIHLPLHVPLTSATTFPIPTTRKLCGKVSVSSAGMWVGTGFPVPSVFYES